MNLELRQRSINNHSMDGYCEKNTHSLRIVLCNNQGENKCEFSGTW